MKRPTDITFLDNLNEEPLPLDPALETFPLIIESKDVYDAAMSAYMDKKTVRNGPVGVANQTPSSTIRVFKKDNAYHLFADIWELSLYDDISISLQIWLRSLSTDDVVYIYLDSVSYSTLKSGDIFYYSPFLNTLLSVKAKTVFSVDYMTKGIAAYFALACSDINISSFSHLTIENALPPTVLAPIFTSLKILVDILLQKGIKHGLLTEADVVSINDNTAVTLTYDVLKNRASLSE